ncbi:MAG: SH3 domain-containing protein [Lachnospiraceae bacterium]|nr:SH3 domain-containing protein [Lachnospiraceae bacterium]
MKKRTVMGSCLALALTMSCAAYGVRASSVTGETEMAGISMMIQEYYYSQAAVNEITDPEAIVPEEDAADEGVVTDIAGMSVNPDSVPVDNAVTDEQVMAGAADIPADSAPVTDVSQQPVEAPVSDVPADAAQPDAAQNPADTGAPEQQPEEEKSQFENVGISIANEYVNIRKRPNVESKILGKLYRGSAATIVATKGDWVKIKSGSVEGYIKSEYLAIGKKAEKLVDKYGTKLATVRTTTLKVREERNTECTVLTLVPDGEVFEVTKEYKDWVKIIVDDETRGYVSREYVELSVEFKEAISIEEEEALERQRREAEEAAREAEEAARAAALARQQQAAAASNNSRPSSSSSNNRPSSSGSNKSSSTKDSSSSQKHTDTGKVSTGSGTGSDAAAYAQKFIGNKYTYGGTSLTNGTDCSGFVQSVYSKYGISLPRTSGSQAGSGKSVSLDNVAPGDIIYYSSGGRVNHVGIYIGDGKIVHASNRRTGITTSNMRYRTPSGARRVAE